MLTTVKMLQSKVVPWLDRVPRDGDRGFRVNGKVLGPAFLFLRKEPSTDFIWLQFSIEPFYFFMLNQMMATLASRNM
jgi:hypothetical protein